MDTSLARKTKGTIMIFSQLKNPSELVFKASRKEVFFYSIIFLLVILLDRNVLVSSHSFFEYFNTHSP